MTTLVLETDPVATNVEVSSDHLSVYLADGRVVSVPLSWFPRLQHGSPEERSNWRLLGEGDGIEWQDLDEHIGVDGLLAGRRSGESAASFNRWLASRSQGMSSAGASLVEYRRRRGADTWHWCRNCTTYPESDAEIIRGKPGAGELCNQCRAKELSGSCA